MQSAFLAPKSVRLYCMYMWCSLHCTIS